MTHYKLLFPNKYLAAHDLQGKDATLTIRAVVREELKTKKGSEMRPVLYFEETAAKAKRDRTEEKRMVLNITNADTVAAVTGATDYESWIGKRITLFAAMVDAFGAMKEALRVRPTPPPKQPAPAPTEPTNPEPTPEN